MLFQKISGRTFQLILFLQFGWGCLATPWVHGNIISDLQKEKAGIEKEKKRLLVRKSDAQKQIVELEKVKKSELTEAEQRACDDPCKADVVNAQNGCHHLLRELLPVPVGQAYQAELPQGEHWCSYLHEMVLNSTYRNLAGLRSKSKHSACVIAMDQCALVHSFEQKAEVKSQLEEINKDIKEKDDEIK